MSQSIRAFGVSMFSDTILQAVLAPASNSSGRPENDSGTVPIFTIFAQRKWACPLPKS